MICPSTKIQTCGSLPKRIKNSILFMMVFGMIISLVHVVNNYIDRDGPVISHENIRIWSMVNSTMDENFFQKIKILCFITTTAKELTNKAQAVNNTWGGRCNKMIFVVTSKSKIADESVLTVNIPDDREHLLAKSVAAFSFIYENYREDYHWILKADDDTYIIMENLRFLLSNHNYNESAYLGYHFKVLVEQGFMSGGAGYVLSQKALYLLYEKGIRNQTLCPFSGTEEDVEIGKCLDTLKVPRYSTLDKYNRQSFHPNLPASFIVGPTPVYLKEYAKSPQKVGKDCCSQLTISFHYLDPKSIYVIHFLLYRLSVYGLKKPENFNNFFLKEISYIHHDKPNEIFMPTLP